jgi:photosystem II stability/assembly factor-like uncharacterized protein
MFRSFVLSLVIVAFACNSIFSAGWKQVYQYPGPESCFFVAIKCADSNNCYAAAQVGNLFRLILKSEDGGNTWFESFKHIIDFNKPPYIIYPEFYDLESPAKDLCIIACDTGKIFRTSDGGKNWEWIKLPTKKPCRDIDMLDSLNGLAITYNELFRTTDGGINWEYLENVPPVVGYRTQGFRNVAMLTKNVYIIRVDTVSVGGDHYVLKTVDGGKTWENYSFPAMTMKFFLLLSSKWYFVDSLNGWAAGERIYNQWESNLTIAYTSDGGESWEIQHDRVYSYDKFNFNEGLDDVVFVDRNNGIAVGSGHTILRTTNGGQNWFPEFVDIMDWARTSVVCSVNSNSYLIADGNGKIFKSDETLNADKASYPDLERSFLLIPNPVGDKLTIVRGNAKNEILKIYDVLGNCVLSTDIIGFESAIEISSLSTGVYLVQIGKNTQQMIKR